MSDVNQMDHAATPSAATPPVPPAPTRRRWFWPILMVLVLVLATTSYAAVVLINRVFLTGWVARALPEGVLVRRVHLRWPATMVIHHARWASAARPNAPWLQVPYATLDVDLASLLLRRVVIRRVVLDRPRITLLHTTEGWNLPRLGGRAPSLASSGGATPSRWHVTVLSAEMKQGTVVLDDRSIPGGFRGELTACDLHVHHPLLPFQGWRAQVELKTLASLRPDRPKAPVHLQGWVDVRSRDLDGTLTVKEFDIGALEPYLNQGRLVVHLYQARLNMTAALKARRNDFSADGQLELTHLTEGDVSIKGVSLLNLKDASGGQNRSLQLQLQVQGPLDHPRAWRPRIMPTGEQTIRLLRPLFEGRKETIILKILPQVTSEQAVKNVEEVVKSVGKGLRGQLQQLLETPPADEEAPTASPAPSPAPPPARPEALPASPADQTTSPTTEEPAPAPPAQQ